MCSLSSCEATISVRSSDIGVGPVPSVSERKPLVSSQQLHAASFSFCDLSLHTTWELDQVTEPTHASSKHEIQSMTCEMAEQQADAPSTSSRSPISIVRDAYQAQPVVSGEHTLAERKQA